MKLKISIFWRSRKRYYIPNVRHTGNKKNQPLETQSEPAMRRCAELTGLDVPQIGRAHV